MKRPAEEINAAIDAQVQVMSERMSEDEVYEVFGDDDADDFDQHILDSAHHAYLWMVGTPDYESPSADWVPLVQPSERDACH